MVVFVWILLLCIFLLIMTLLISYLWISVAARRYLYRTTEALPFRETTLLLGTAKLTGKGHLNNFFSNRITKAVEVFQENKTRKIILSGADNPPKRPDEVDDMYDALLELQIDSDHILVDHRGTRTWNSIGRCKKKFKETSPLIVSQRFHNQRAVFIALKMGMDPIAVDATMVTGRAGLRMLLREAFARVKCLMDCYLLKPEIP